MKLGWWAVVVVVVVIVVVVRFMMTMTMMQDVVVRADDEQQWQGSRRTAVGSSPSLLRAVEKHPTTALVTSESSSSSSLSSVLRDCTENPDCAATDDSTSMCPCHDHNNDNETHCFPAFARCHTAAGATSRCFHRTTAKRYVSWLKNGSTTTTTLDDDDDDDWDNIAMDQNHTCGGDVAYVNSIDCHGGVIECDLWMGDEENCSRDDNDGSMFPNGGVIVGRVMIDTDDSRVWYEWSNRTALVWPNPQVPPNDDYRIASVHVYVGPTELPTRRDTGRFTLDPASYGTAVWYAYPGVRYAVVDLNASLAGAGIGPGDFVIAQAHVCSTRALATSSLGKERSVPSVLPSHQPSLSPTYSSPPTASPRPIPKCPIAEPLPLICPAGNLPRTPSRNTFFPTTLAHPPTSANSSRSSTSPSPSATPSHEPSVSEEPTLTMLPPARRRANESSYQRKQPKHDLLRACNDGCRDLFAYQDDHVECFDAFAISGDTNPGPPAECIFQRPQSVCWNNTTAGVDHVNETAVWNNPVACRGGSLEWTLWRGVQNCTLPRDTNHSENVGTVYIHTHNGTIEMTLSNSRYTILGAFVEVTTDHWHGPNFAQNARYNPQVSKATLRLAPRIPVFSFLSARAKICYKPTHSSDCDPIVSNSTGCDGKFDWENVKEEPRDNYTQTPSSFSSTRSNRSTCPIPGPYMIDGCYPNVSPPTFTEIPRRSSNPNGLPPSIEGKKKNQQESHDWPSIVPRSDSFQPAATAVYKPHPTDWPLSSTPHPPSYVPFVRNSSKPTPHVTDKKTAGPSFRATLVHVPSGRPVATKPSTPFAKPTASPSYLASRLSPSITDVPSVFSSLDNTSLPTQASQLKTNLPTVKGTFSNPTVSTFVSTHRPTLSPSHKPSLDATPLLTAAPTAAPSISTLTPTFRQTLEPTRAMPLSSPTEKPQKSPSRTLWPVSTLDSSHKPNLAERPTTPPHSNPTFSASQHPTARLLPKAEPTYQTTFLPTQAPLAESTREPSTRPTRENGIQPTKAAIQTQFPTYTYSLSPLPLPTEEPFISPTSNPYLSRSHNPIAAHTVTGESSGEPTLPPTQGRTPESTTKPSTEPSRKNANKPTKASIQTQNPTSTFGSSHFPTLSIAAAPTLQPVYSHLPNPTLATTRSTTAQPTAAATNVPTLVPIQVKIPDHTPKPSIGLKRRNTFKPTTASVRTQWPTFSRSLPQHSPSPTRDPTVQPTSEPTLAPSHKPTLDATHSPTAESALPPTFSRTSKSTTGALANPSSQNAGEPTRISTRTQFPSQPSDPTVEPTLEPTFPPSHKSTMDATYPPAARASLLPTPAKNLELSQAPSTMPTRKSSFQPTEVAEFQTTTSPVSLLSSFLPTWEPTVEPTSELTFAPSHIPTLDATHLQTNKPTLLKASLKPSQNPIMSLPTKPATLTQWPASISDSSPLSLPTEEPTIESTVEMTSTHKSTPDASLSPTSEPTDTHAVQPFAPTQYQKSKPTMEPSSETTMERTNIQTQWPTLDSFPSFPSIRPTEGLNIVPTSEPQSALTHKPTNVIAPSAAQTSPPKQAPPTSKPTNEPSAIRTIKTSGVTQWPTFLCSDSASLITPTKPNVESTSGPTLSFSIAATSIPTLLPSADTTAVPTYAPALKPTQGSVSNLTPQPTAKPAHQNLSKTTPPTTSQFSTLASPTPFPRATVATVSKPSTAPIVPTAVVLLPTGQPTWHYDDDCAICIPMIISDSPRKSEPSINPRRKRGNHMMTTSEPSRINRKKPRRNPNLPSRHDIKPTSKPTSPSQGLEPSSYISSRSPKPIKPSRSGSKPYRRPSLGNKNPAPIIRPHIQPTAKPTKPSQRTNRNRSSPAHSQSSFNPTWQAQNGNRNRSSQHLYPTLVHLHNPVQAPKPQQKPQSLTRNQSSVTLRNRGRADYPTQKPTQVDRNRGQSWRSSNTTPKPTRSSQLRSRSNTSSNNL